MKRYIRTSEVSTSDYLEYVQEIVSDTELSDMIGEIRPDSTYPNEEIVITLKEPYKCKYIGRYHWFDNKIYVVDSPDFYGTGEPDCFLLMRKDKPKDAQKRLAALITKIHTLTNRYLVVKQHEADMEAMTDNDIWKMFESDKTFNNLIEAMCYEAYDNHDFYVPTVRRYIITSIKQDAKDGENQYSEIYPWIEEKIFNQYIKAKMKEEDRKYDYSRKYR